MEVEFSVAEASSDDKVQPSLLVNSMFSYIFSIFNMARMNKYHAIFLFSVIDKAYYNISDFLDHHSKFKNI